jgi:hypothetical protein
VGVRGRNGDSGWAMTNSLTDPTIGNLNIRVSTAEDDDSGSLDGLAARSGATAPSGPVMLAEIDGEPVAAVTLAEGTAFEDPCRSDASILTLLRLRRWEFKLITAVFGA